ncbi:MAG: ASKHA domain-containing protein [Dehalococcoidales bacterium]|nr:ASKHA domain-containing protein [Dehalococcoidales bacterium]
MKTYKVTFLPEKKEIEVEEDTTLLQAAEKADAFINNLCGGEGLCGECRVQIVSGNAHPDKHTLGFLTGEEIEQGFVLACQTKVKDNLTVMVPVKSRAEQEKILMTGSPVVYGEPEKVVLTRRPRERATSYDPLVKKVYLPLPEPTLQDNISDIDRITRELRKVTPYQDFEISLACLQNLADKLRENDWKVTATVARHNDTGRILKIEEGDTSNRDYGLAIDIGTTTVVVQLIHLKTGKILATKGSHNLQARYGEDVISRMVFACTRGSVDPVHKAIIANINNLTRALIKDCRINPEDIDVIVAAGNTTMSHFLLNLRPCAIRLEPYVPTATVYPQIFAREVGIEISKQGILETVPSVASYIGGDIVAGVLACGMADRPETRCLIDIGTNGEIVIGNNEWLVCCSASAGPAFEGAGARSGMRATAGAIEKVEIKDGTVQYETIGKVKASGICGSGLIDVIYEMVRNGIIDQNGKFNTTRQNPRLNVEDGDLRYLIVPASESETSQPITISEAEIANLMKSKGAVFAAIKSLTDYVGLSFDKFENIYVAGGFGSSLNIPKAIAIGLLPDIDTKRMQFIGNSSLTGARMALMSIANYEKTLEIGRRMTNIELSNYTPFMNEFIAALFLPHTDSKLFPSVKYRR